MYIGTSIEGAGERGRERNIIYIYRCLGSYRTKAFSIAMSQFLRVSGYISNHTGLVATISPTPQKKQQQHFNLESRVVNFRWWPREWKLHPTHHLKPFLDEELLQRPAAGCTTKRPSACWADETGRPQCYHHAGGGSLNPWGGFTGGVHKAGG